ncbi:MAG: hypothetical protein JWO98_5332 [Frankiales bacterium]|nr:hypothetical protein [Frankiales bacterium]
MSALKHHLTTTIDPTTEITVDESEYTDLKRLGLVDTYAKGPDADSWPAPKATDAPTGDDGKTPEKKKGESA